ncbi:methyltransferase domain-containing protein [Methanosalsum natronophilum]|uniref:Methyltransferase domain-containing protein n=1 Tax=Methanosalsum natronophilum TaxID=768733 RepID=A0A3R7XIK4_9EURY|nr:MAG: methyltransferase domain-containing protein [Methanosalsum natronophilum]
MKKKKLEITLEKVERFKSPNHNLEQYSTPAIVASSMLHFAYMRGDIKDSVIYDLGCGTGILSIGAKLLGAKEVIGFDLDEMALKEARVNANKMSVDIEFKLESIKNIQGNCDTVIMNPPFGAQKKGADRPFLEKAIDLATVIYSIHNYGSYDFISQFIYPAKITDYYTISFPIKRTFNFHTKDLEYIQAEIFRIVKT